MMLRNLGTSLEAGQWGGSIIVPHEMQAAVGALSKGIGALAEFADQLQSTAGIADDLQLQLREEATIRANRDSQMQLTFDEERKKLGAVIEQQSAALEAQSETITEIHRKLDTLLAPQPDLAAAQEALELLRSTPSDGASRELVDVLRKLDDALTSEHVEKTARKIARLGRVVAEAEDLLELDGAEVEGLDGLREALANVQAAR